MIFALSLRGNKGKKIRKVRFLWEGMCHFTAGAYTFIPLHGEDALLDLSRFDPQSALSFMASWVRECQDLPYASWGSTKERAP